MLTVRAAMNRNLIEGNRKLCKQKALIVRCGTASWRQTDRPGDKSKQTGDWLTTKCHDLFKSTRALPPALEIYCFFKVDCLNFTNNRPAQQQSRPLSARQHKTMLVSYAHMRLVQGWEAWVDFLVKIDDFYNSGKKLWRWITKTWSRSSNTSPPKPWPSNEPSDWLMPPRSSELSFDSKLW